MTSVPVLTRARRPQHALAACGLILGLAIAGGAAYAASGGLAALDTAEENTEYDSRFVFVRLRYEMGLRARGGGFFGGDLPWAHDYPRAERNLTRILDEITSLNPFQGPRGGNILTLDDPDLHRFPFAYMSEPGYWTLNDDEALGLRTYLQKGGFLVFDDFRGDHWFNFEAQMRRVLPDARLVELDISHPIFHAFFDIETLDMPWMYNLPPRFYGIFEDNDPTRRLMVIANFNNDIGEYWEYKFGVNYVMYSMTH